MASASIAAHVPTRPVGLASRHAGRAGSPGCLSSFTLLRKLRGERENVDSLFCGKARMSGAPHGRCLLVRAGESLDAEESRVTEEEDAMASFTRNAMLALDASETDNAAGPASGPVELPQSGTNQEPEASPLETAGSLLFTGALTVLLFRLFRRRAAKAKEEKLRSTAVERLSPAKVAADLAATSAAGPAAPPPNPISAFSGAVVAGLFAYIAYSFTTGVDEFFAEQAVPTNYTARNITITVRTIISGMGWLATGVFGANSLGLFLFGIQIGLGLNKEAQAPTFLESNQSLETAAKEEPKGEDSKGEKKQ